MITIQPCVVFRWIRTRINRLSILQLVLRLPKGGRRKYLSCKFGQTATTIIDRRGNLQIRVDHIARGTFSARLFLEGQVVYLVGRHWTWWLSMDRLCQHLFP